MTEWSYLFIGVLLLLSVSGNNFGEPKSKPGTFGIGFTGARERIGVL